VTTGAAFAISNLGMDSAEILGAIINPHNRPNMACGAAAGRPVVRNSRLCVGTEMDAAVRLDQRLIDGAIAVDCLATVCSILEDSSCA
jgi:pyruvate dehydrogenase E2 component (dihydrolipoamide acetyltransferase)